MANAAYIVVKGEGDQNRRVSYKDFYGPLDKGSSKPSFCYPKRKEALKEEVDKMERLVNSGHIAKEHEMDVKIKLKEKKDRLKGIEAQEGEAQKLFNKNKDKWMERRSALAEEIAAKMPSRDNVSKRRVNPHTVLKEEKAGGLGEKKKEYIVLSRLAGEESNTTFLQRDK
jgi:hypothetical protein